MPHAPFPTPFGDCVIAWDNDTLIGFSLPGGPYRFRSDAIMEPPAWIAAIIARVQRHLAGEPQDFSDLAYDFSNLSAFNRRVLQATLAIKSGQTASYGQIAAAMGEPPTASRGVGAALGANPWPLLIPCHRITAANGKMTGFSAPGGIRTKTRLLALEGAQLLSE